MTIETGRLTLIRTKLQRPRLLGRLHAGSSRKLTLIAAQTGARLTLTDDVAEDAKGADYLYTDVGCAWASLLRFGRSASSCPSLTRSTPKPWS